MTTTDVEQLGNEFGRQWPTIRRARSNACADPRFAELREVSHHFQDTLEDAFFEQDTPLREFIRRYGVF